MSSFASEIETTSYGVFNDTSTLTTSDSDNDGIADISDNCPTQPETVNGSEDADGCPDVPTVKDTDGDGILNSDDLCPRESETINNYLDLDGCPDTVATADYDDDGIINTMDKCQFEAEIITGYKDADGCLDVPQINSNNDEIPTSYDKCPEGQTNIDGKCVADSPKDSASDVVQ
ncbi:MAG: thrombospondin type 3 repeat-containing protein [Thaumarchaeota archaeon]|nr:thrombospondin type 3 repeat-containing protein [Nitrososphaerota archaeon]